MKLASNKYFNIRNHFTVTIIFLAFTLMSCSKKLYFEKSTILPQAQGTVKIKKDKNNNYTIDIDIEYLAESARLTPPKEMYVVWAETEANGIKNIGQINSRSGLLGGKLKASTDTRVPFKPTRIFITAEDVGNGSTPAGQTVLTTETFHM